MFCKDLGMFGTESLDCFLGGEHRKVVLFDTIWQPWCINTLFWKHWIISMFESAVEPQGCMLYIQTGRSGFHPVEPGAGSEPVGVRVSMLPNLIL